MIKKNKSILILAVIAGFGIILILFGSISIRDSTNAVEALDPIAYTNQLEAKIESFLLSIDGIKKANVIITLDTSNEHVYAQNQSTYDFLTINSSNGESPVYITEIYPTVRGIAISCTGGDRDDVKMKITKLVSAYLGISSNRIEIVPIK